MCANHLARGSAILDNLAMTVERRNFPQFFITAPSPCPYLPGQKERKVFTHLVGPDARALAGQLLQSGYRRSQSIAYRPACEFCSACASTRVPVKDFVWTKSFRRVLKANADLISNAALPQATSEHYDVFRAYIDTRHADGGMADMSVLDFAAMIDETVVDTRLIEYRYGPQHAEAGALVATVLLDVLPDGLSLIYSFYDPTLQHRSLGTHIILDCIQKTHRLKLPYLYLGYFVSGSRKMEYKSRFQPQQRLSPSGWISVGPS